MITLFKIIFVFLVVKGAFLIIDYINKEPGGKTSKALGNAVVIKQSIMNRILTGFIMPIAEMFAIYIKIPAEKEREMKGNLARADIALSPQLYYARAIVITFCTMPMIFLVMLIGVRWMIPFTILLVFLIFYRFMTGYKDKLKEKKEKIEMGLPGFVRAILYKLNDSAEGIVKADLISIFEDYLKVANEVFYYDVSILIMEMKSKDIETAIRNFNNRVGIPEVSFLCNALIGITRGERQNETLRALARDMDVKARENIRRQLQKRPGKVIVASIPLVLVGVASLVYVIVATIISGVSTLT